MKVRLKDFSLHDRNDQNKSKLLGLIHMSTNIHNVIFLFVIDVSDLKPLQFNAEEDHLEFDDQRCDKAKFLEVIGTECL